jgi:hypothetical protein
MGRVTVRIGAPLELSGDSFMDLARKVEDAVRKL